MHRLRTIRPDQARLGMFVHGFDGSWLSHPFWRRRFRLEDPADLARLRDSEVGVIIDESLGCRLVEEAAPSAPAAPARPCPAVAPVIRPAPRRAQDPELAHAKELMARSHRIVRQLFGDARLGKAINSAAARGLVEEISASVARSAHALIGISRLKSKDEYTYLHSVAVCALMINLARHLDLPEERTRRIGVAGLLHDVGKMAIPNSILNKPGPLTEEEWRAVHAHPESGYDLLQRGADLPAEALDVCLHHHERPGGGGYPFGLSGDALSLPARMGAICDVYDALTSNRAYKPGWTPSQAVTAMAGWHGQFDEALLFRFFRSLGVFPVGRVVRLRTNRLALALDNGRRGSRQTVLAFYALGERRLIEPQRIVLGDTLAHDQVVGDGEADAAAIAQWECVRTGLLAATKRFEPAE